MRQLFKKRYTKEGVRAFYSKDRHEVHLSFPDKDEFDSPFKSKALFEDVLDVIRKRYGIYITWTAYCDEFGIEDDSYRFLDWEEVIL